VPSDLLCHHLAVAATGPRTAVIVDDHAGFRTQAARMLEAAGYQVVGSCPDAHAALALLARVRPDLVLVDVQLPGLDGFGLVARLGSTMGGAHRSIGAGRVADATGAIGGLADDPGGTAASPATGGVGGMTVVLVSSREAADYGSRVGQSGAAGFITKAELTARSLAALVEADRR
jgi:DNA-binding NarL/FixJ family response regulator